MRRRSAKLPERVIISEYGPPPTSSTAFSITGDRAMKVMPKIDPCEMPYQCSCCGS
ncbi:MAG TPA: hypothetical protein VGB85_21595 [Nannocystis sp.]